MSSVHKNLSIFKTENLPDISWKKFVVLVAEWNDDITEALAQGAINTLLKYGAKDANVLKVYVPGSFELSYGAQVYAQKEEIDAIIAIGCVIQGETKHNDYINHAVAEGLTEVSLKYNKPVIFGVLTPNTHQQAADRAGGKLGNKGDEAAITAIKMLGLK
jgi:6,7-dimethyl-8-ribityllumazine synthase